MTLRRLLVVLLLLAPASPLLAGPNCFCHMCRLVRSASQGRPAAPPTVADLVVEHQSAVTTIVPPAAGASATSVSGPAAASAPGGTQVVYLDFDGGTDFGETPYTAFERQQILSLVRED